MRSYKSLVAILATLFVAVTTLSADSLIVSVTFLGAGSVNDGTDYVLPYALNIAGTDIDADCYDYLDQIQNGQTWQAYEYPLDTAANQGQYSGQSNSLADYEEVAWLSSQATHSAQDQIDLQHVIWNVFDPAAFGVVTPGMAVYMDALAQADLSVFDFADYSFVEAVPVPGISLAQAFVIETPATINGGQNPGPTPEPAAWILLSVGLGLIVIAKTVTELRRKRRT